MGIRLCGPLWVSDCVDPYGYQTVWTPEKKLLPESKSNLSVIKIDSYISCTFTFLFFPANCFTTAFLDLFLSQGETVSFKQQFNFHLRPFIQ
jgi:hypothetical protein